MKTRHLVRWAGACTLSALAGLAAAAATPYERMAPLEQYLMPAGAEIALARSAAPAAISDKATVLTLDAQGYQTAVRGTNGFTCLVERSWLAPFESPDFWNPQIRGPVCYNPAASRSVLAYTLRRTKLALAGDSKQTILDEVRFALARNELPAPEPGAMSFMMSKGGYLSDADSHWHPHLMFHVPKVAGASWGANLPGSPVVLDDREVPEYQTIFMVPVSRWSDGTTAAAH
jgi:hypothetical protein